MQRWCCSRRDTRGKRGYDGGGGAGMTEVRRGTVKEGDVADEEAKSPAACAKNLKVVFVWPLTRIGRALPQSRPPQTSGRSSRGAIT